jgi:hypothetical protein
LLKENCPWHLDGNHTTEQCYQLRRALKDTPEPRHPHDKKGKKKADEGNGDFQEPDKTVNVLFGGLPNRWAQKATRREVMSIAQAVPTPLRWLEVPITFSRADQWTSFSEPGRSPLVLKPVVASLLTVYFGTSSMFITLWFGFDYGTNPPLGTLII